MPTDPLKPIRLVTGVVYCGLWPLSMHRMIKLEILKSKTTSTFNFVKTETFGAKNTSRLT